MLLGIAYHASFAYVPGIGPWYVVQDVSTGAPFGVIGNVLHAGRMQVFFALAGYFAHLVAARGDLTAFVVDRARRFVVPLLVAVPLVMLFDWGSQRWALEHGLLDAAYRGWGESAMRPLHLWFLEYAAIFSLACWPLRGVAMKWRLPPELMLGLSAFTAGAHLVLGEPTPAFTFVPQLASVVHFGPFFAVGWLLRGSAASLAGFRRCGWLGPVGVALAAWVSSRPLQYQPTGVVLSSVATWAVVLGAIAVAVRITGAPSPRVRWLVEASYWVYLSHYPVVVATQLALAREPWPAWVKYGVVLLAASAVSLGSYALVVRRSAVGRWLTPSMQR